jgi:hypothetical protein
MFSSSILLPVERRALFSFHLTTLYVDYHMTLSQLLTLF